MSAEGPIRVGVVGCGEIAQIMHLPILHELDGFEIAGLCDLSAQTLSALGDRYGVSRLTTEADALLHPDAIDAVVVCTYDHAPVVAAAIDAGLHVLVEKPLAFTAAEGRALRDAARAAQVVALVGYMKLFDPALDAFARRLRRAEGIRAITCHDFAGSFERHGSLYTSVRAADVPEAVLDATRHDVDRRIAGMLGDEHAGHAALYALLLMLGSHDLAVMRHLFGAPDGIAYARARGDDQLLAVLDYPGDVPCVLEVAVGTTYPWWDEWVAVSGADTALTLQFPNPYVRHASSTIRVREPSDGADADQRITVSAANPFRLEWQHFGDCIRAGAPNRSPLDGGVADLELAHAIIDAMAPRRVGVSA